MSAELPVRGGRVRRRGGPRRASGGFSPRRALAALVMLAAAGATWGVVASPVFDVTTVEVEGATLTGDDAIRAALALPSPAPNAFVLATDELRARLLALPAVADAHVSVGLPGTIRARVAERAPVLAWRRGRSLWLVDRDGRVLADAAAPGAPAAATAADGLPVVEDRRASGVGQAIGEQVDPLDLDVATRLLSLTPADVGSSAPALVVAVDDRDGWTVAPDVANPWVAVFGFYGPQVRQPAMIPEQVRSLRSLLAGREARMLRVVLAGEREGTFTEKPGS
ncbi:MAG: FtsQ-type POTRA domain-containing protein [Chloroflexi bacterium]|nr:FtsQ-type POTRA domain-containing protein [Chloroflexota bacterium]